jgi:hypothetical protein
MKETYNTYPRGVTLSATSPTAFNLNMPESAAEKAVFWLSRSGFVYKTYDDALQDTAAAIPQELLAQINLLPGERLFYKHGNMNVITDREVNVLPEHLLIVSCVEKPFCLPVPNQKPGNKSTLWISRNYKAFHSYKEAFNDKPGSSTKAVMVMQRNVRKSAARKQNIGLFVVLAAILFVIYVFNKYGKQQNKYAGNREVVPAIPE